MLDYKFLENKTSGKWVILAPRRAKRPDVAREASSFCPFCSGRENEEAEVYRIDGSEDDSPLRQSDSEASNWQIRVVPNKFPFTPNHEVVIHSPDHHKNFDELPREHVETIIQVYRHRFNAHKDKGQVYIFHNRGEGGGESLPHPHTQLTVIPFDVKTEIPLLPENFDGKIDTGSFSISCPVISQWPDEVWIIPKIRNKSFGQISDKEISDLAFVLNRIIKILDLRHGHEFPFNFYIHPGNDWYLRIIPREKSLGGFEVGTGIFVNTMDPADTFNFIREHFDTLDEEKIKKRQKADYGKSV